jgi:hypothetical protein
MFVTAGITNQRLLISVSKENRTHKTQKIDCRQGLGGPRRYPNSSAVYRHSSWRLRILTEQPNLFRAVLHRWH